MRKVIVFICCSILWASPAYSQYRGHYLPPSVSVDVDGERHQAFDLGGYQRLLEIDEDLFHTQAMHSLCEESLSVARESVVELRRGIDAREVQLDLLEAERARLSAMWREENRLRHLAENRPQIGSWVAWSVAAVAAVAAVVLGIVVGVQN